MPISATFGSSSDHGVFTSLRSKKSSSLVLLELETVQRGWLGAGAEVS